MIALITERTDPDLGSIIHACISIKSGGAGLTAERRVGERRNLRMRTDRRDAGGERDDTLASFDFGARPGVP